MSYNELIKELVEEDYESYMKEMTQGAKLYDNWRQASGRARGEAEDAYDKWFNKTYRR